MKFWNKIKLACAELSPNCHEAVRAQSEALDHPLPPARRLGLWLHLLICRWCRRYSDQIRFLHRAAHDHEHDAALTGAAPAQLPPEARERIKQQLREKK
jgi:hypothetical protein